MQTVKIVNITPHAIVVRTPAGDTTFQPDGTVARVSVSTAQNGTINGFETRKDEFGGVEGLPAQSPDVFFIVSRMVKEAAKERGDLLSPDTGKTAIRNEQGQIVAVTGFIF